MTAAGMVPALQAVGLGKTYPADWRGRRVPALSEVTFTISPGTVVALVGPNGSGKSTLLKLCAGLSEPTAGTVDVAGRPAAEARRGGGIGYLAEETHYPRGLGVRAWLRGLAELDSRLPEPEGAVEQVLAEVGLTAEAEQRIGNLSKGQRQRLGLAQARLGSPELLLLDEPATGLDPRAVEAWMALVRRWREAGRTVVFSSHFLPQVEEVADRILLLAQGRLVAAVTAAEARAAGGLHRLYLERTDA